MSMLHSCKKLLLTKRFNGSNPILCEQCGFELELSARRILQNPNPVLKCSCGHSTAFEVRTVRGAGPEAEQVLQVSQIKADSSRICVRTYPAAG